MMQTDSLSHPLRLSSGRMPHDLDPAMFGKWLKMNEMTEHDYWVQVGTDQDLSELYGKPVLTAALNQDQRGWAKQRFAAHYQTNGAKWYIRKGKTAVPIPAIKMSSTSKRRRRHGS